jgi:hypothetical protein
MLVLWKVACHALIIGYYVLTVYHRKVRLSVAHLIAQYIILLIGRIDVRNSSEPKKSSRPILVRNV